MTAWTDFVRDFAKRNNLTYGCALSDPNCSAEYKAKKPTKGAKTKKEKNENESMGAEDTLAEQKAKRKAHKDRTTSLKAKVNKKQVEKQLVESVGMLGEDKDAPAPPSRAVSQSDPTTTAPAKKKAGRPKKYATAEEAKEAKKVKTIESNNRRREAKKKGVVGGATSKQKGISAEIRGRLDNIPSHDRYAIQIKDQLSNIIHSADLNPKPSNPYKDITNSFDPKAEKTISKALDLLHQDAKVAILKPHAPKLPAKKKGRPPKNPTKILKPAKVPLPTQRPTKEDYSALQEQLESDRETARKLALQQERELHKPVLELPAPAKKKGRPPKGRGIVAGYTTEGDNGLSHIYPLSYDHIEKLLHHLL